MKYGRITALICSAFLAPLSAENYTHVSGVILDASSSSVPGALISVVNEDTGLRRMTLSQPDGGYVVSSLLPGVYKISVRKTGFRTMIRFGVKLVESQPERVDFNLIVGSVQETVTVEGSTPLLNTKDASVGTLVERDEIEQLPVNGGGLLTLLQLAPGTVVTPATRGEAGQFTVNGQRPNTHYFTVDGVSANSGVGGGGLPAQSTGGTLPGFTAFGSLDSLVSLDALEEMRVQTSTTMSEFGRMPGAQVSLTSRSGTNELHGSLLYGFRNEALGANDWFANRHGDPRAQQQEQEFAATLGGPVWRDHTFFFLSYEGMRLHQPFVFNQPVPTLAARNFAGGAGPLLSLFPAPNGPDLGSNLALWTAGISRPSQLDTGAVRLDHAFSPRLTAFARYNESPSSTEFGSDPVNTLDLSSRGFTLGLNLRARPNLVLDVRTNVSSSTSHSVWRQAGPTVLPPCALGPSIAIFNGPPNTCDYLVRLSIAGVGQVFSGSEGQRSQTQLQISPSASWTPGTHSIRFGADYRRLGPARSDATGSLSILADTVRDLASRGNFYTANSPPQHISAVLREISLFAQDTWRVMPRLTVTYGLRWEISPAPTLNAPVSLLDATGNGNLAPVQKPIWQSTYANFAPRFGVAFQPAANGRTLIRGGMGFYYDSSLSLATDLVNNGPLNVTQYSSQRTQFFITQLGFGFMPDLRLPLVKQWNIAVEHAFTARDVVSVGYVGSSSSNLIRREITDRIETVPFITLLALATNHGSSDYNALEAQYHRRLARGFQAQLSYAWSHSLDNSSADSGLYFAGSKLTPAQDHASSDFDVRHSLSAGFTYEIPHSHGWALDGVFRARTGFPINVLNAEQSQGISYENAFRPNLIGGLPVWIADPSAPGGRRINRDAFQALPLTVRGDPQQGNLGRNALSGLGMSQLDLAARREFSFGEQRSLQLRVEAFNAFNHANFADPIRFLFSPLFGQSTSMLNLMLGTGSPSSGLAPMFQAGGARAMQVVVRFKF